MKKKLIEIKKQNVKVSKNKNLILIKNIVCIPTDDHQERLNKLIKLLVPVPRKGS